MEKNRLLQMFSDETEHFGHFRQTFLRDAPDSGIIVIPVRHSIADSFVAHVRVYAEYESKVQVTIVQRPCFSLVTDYATKPWKLVKSKCLRNHYYEDFGSFRSAIDSFLASLRGKNRPLLQSLITENFQLYTNPKT